MSEHSSVVPEILTPDETARFLRVTPVTVYRNLQNGKLPGNKVGGQWRIRRVDLEAWLRGRDTWAIACHARRHDLLYTGVSERLVSTSGEYHRHELVDTGSGARFWVSSVADIDHYLTQRTRS